MALVGNNAEGGTNGVTVTTGNSGGASGTAFSSVLNGATLKFDNTQAAHGTLSYHVVTTTTETVQFQLSGASSGSYAIRFYIRFNTPPFAGERLLQVGSGAKWAIGTGPKFTILDFNGNVANTFTTTIATGVWYRLELELRTGTTTSNGYHAARYFLGDATTPVEPGYSNSATNAGVNAVFSVGIFGVNTGIWAEDFWMDDLAIADGTTTPIGPASVPPTPASGTASLTFAASASAAAVAVLFAGWGIPL